MKLTYNELQWILNNKKLPEDIKEKVRLEYERNKVNELLDTENDAFNMCGIKEILERLINNETIIRDVSKYIYHKYHNEPDDIYIYNS
ncbi:hypothetical protein [Clostridium neonatale]|uniref:hypothetical protein n=1 Tax=Clostridium neonatale TaxID=137838 RepID=UPI00291BA795|nr:hypothetical protein [Clostridium neonatale]CAI3207780.1 hypothetical protein CNEO2_360046 [Clostridium neonatale]